MPLRQQSPVWYVIDLSVQPPSCLPAGLDASRLIDITRVGDFWRRYYNPETGAVHEGEEYAKQASCLP